MRIARDERSQFHQNATPAELIEHYAPINMDPRDWPNMWFRTFDEEQVQYILAARHDRRAEWTLKQQEAKQSMDGQRLESPRACVCGGTGWVSGAEMFPVGDSLGQWGQVVPCACTVATTINHRTTLYWKQSGLPPDSQQARQTFQNFKTNGHSDLEFAMSECVAWAQEQEPDWLILTGTTGTGKTHLARGAIAAVLWQQKQGRYIDAPELRDMFANPIDDEAMGKVSQFMRAEYLVIDDIGREHVTAYSTDRLHRILDYRTDRHMKTLLTTNATEEQLVETYGAPLVSRMMHGSIVVIQAPDWRTH